VGQLERLIYELVAQVNADWKAAGCPPLRVLTCNNSWNLGRFRSNFFVSPTKYGLIPWRRFGHGSVINQIML